MNGPRFVPEHDMERPVDFDECWTCGGRGELADHINEWGAVETVRCPECYGTGEAGTR